MTILRRKNRRPSRFEKKNDGGLYSPPLQHQHAVLAVALSANGKTALTGSEDEMARLWQTATGKLIGAPLHHQDEIAVVALAPMARSP